MFTEQDVRNAYRIILGRDQESEAVLRLHARVAKYLRELWLHVFGSTEFAERAKAESSGPDAPPMVVDVVVSDEQSQRLLDCIHKQWRHLGEPRPH